MNKEIENYLEKHNACSESAVYALTQNSMKEVWDNCPKLKWLLWMVQREDKNPEKELRLFAVWCARQVQHLMKDKRSLDALDVAERYAYGNATEGELAAARVAYYARDHRSGACAAWCATEVAKATWEAVWVAKWTSFHARAAARAATWEAWSWWLWRVGVRSVAGRLADRSERIAEAAQIKQFKKMIKNPFK
jgi:hypothetical protein